MTMPARFDAQHVHPVDRVDDQRKGEQDVAEDARQRHARQHALEDEDQQDADESDRRDDQQAFAQGDAELGAFESRAEASQRGKAGDADHQHAQHRHQAGPGRRLPAHHHQREQAAGNGEEQRFVKRGGRSIVAIVFCPGRPGVA